MGALVRELTEADESIFQEMIKRLLGSLGQSDANSPQTVTQPCVFIGHGRSRLWARIKTFLQDELGLATVTYAIGIFFQAAVVAGATERMRGGDPAVSSALAAAGRRLGPIVMWAVVAATVGMVIRLIHDRVGFVGRIIASLVGAAWSLATFFVVPVLVLEDRSIGESFTRSVSVFQQTWGETVVGGTNIGVAAVCAWVTLVAIVGLLASVVGVVALVVFAVGAILLMIIFSALQGVYVASLYRYATEGHATSGFDKTLLDQAFVPKGR